MVPTELEPGPDGAGWWPARFAVDPEWADHRGTAWRAVTNYPGLQARRTDDLLELRQTDDTTIRTYRLDAAANLGGYIATKEI